MTIDVPSGRVVARVRARGGAVDARRLPQRARRTWSRAACRPAGVAVDVAYGGAIYASRAGRAASACASCPSDLPALIAAGRAVKRGARRHRRRAPPRRRAPVGHLRDDPLRATLGAAAPAQRDGLRRRRGRPLAVRLGHLGALRAARRRRRARRRATCCATTRSSARRSTRAWSATSAATACSPRSRAWPTAPASTASCSTRATRSAPASSCDEPALPRRGRGRASACSPRPRSTRSRPRCAAGLDPEADPPRSALARRRRRAARDAVGRGGHAVVKLVTRRRRAAHPGRLRGLRRDDARAGRARRRHRADQRAHAGGLGARGPRASPRPTRAGCSSSAAARRPAAHVEAIRARARRSSTSTWSAATRDERRTSCVARRRRHLLRARPRASRCSTARSWPTTRRSSRSARTSPTRARSTTRSSRRATVVVESRASALREAGDVIGAIAAGALREDALVTLAELVRGERALAAGARACSRAPGWRGRTRWWRPRSSADAVWCCAALDSITEGRESMVARASACAPNVGLPP